LSESAGKPHGSATCPELPGTKRSAGELDGPGDLVGKSVDSTSTSQMAKHFRHHSPLHRELKPINIDDTTNESAVQGEYSDSVEASAARWQASEELSTFLSTTRKPLSKFDRRQIVKDYPRPPSRQSREYSQGVRRPDRQSSRNSAAISPSLGLAELLHSSSPPCPTLLPLPATGKDPSTPITRPSRVSGLSERGGNRGITMVG